MELAVADVNEVVRNVWNCALGFGVEPKETGCFPDTGDRLLGSISISGEWTGTIVLEASIPAARTAAAQMLMKSDAELSRDDLHDVVAELTNIVGGNIKSLVPGPSSLALPSVTSGEDFDLRMSRAALICRADFRTHGEPLRVRVWEKSLV